MIQRAVGAALPSFLNDQDVCTVSILLDCGGYESVLFKWALLRAFRFSPFLQRSEIAWLKVNTHHRYNAIHDMIRADIDGIQTEIIYIGALQLGEPVIDCWTRQNDIQATRVVIFSFIRA